MALHAHPHQHSVKVVGSGASLDEALSHAVAGLTDPEGHYTQMAFQSFDVTKVSGSFTPGGSTTVQVTLEAFASHKD